MRQGAEASKQAFRKIQNSKSLIHYYSSTIFPYLFVSPPLRIEHRIHAPETLPSTHHIAYLQEQQQGPFFNTTQCIWIAHC